MLRDRGIRALGSLLAACLLAAALPVKAQDLPPGAVMRDAVPRLAEAVKADRSQTQKARSLLAREGFDVIATPALPLMAARSGVAVTTGTFDLRIVLGRMAQAFGHEDNSAVLEAQSAIGPHAHMIETGSLRISDLAQVMGKDAVSGTGIVELRAPLIIWRGAELRVEPGELLQLSRTHGAFVLNFGRLVIDGAEVRGVGGESPHNEEFQPFVTTTGAGTMQIRNARISDLGFGSTVKFSGLSVVRTGLDRPATGSFIADSAIDRVRRISVQGATGLIIDGNRIDDAGSAALVILHSHDTQVSANILAGRSVTNAIRVLDGSVGTVLAGNVILKGDRVGILIKNAPNGTHVDRNIVWGREGSGIKLDHARCARLSGNVLIGNRQKGIEVRRSLEARLDGNLLADNKSAGIWVSGQPQGAITRIEGNRLDANGAGIATATAEAILLEGNDFTRQFPRFLAGDLVTQARFVAADIRGLTPIALDASGPVPIADLPSHCAGGG